MKARPAESTTTQSEVEVQSTASSRVVRLTVVIHDNAALATCGQARHAATSAPDAHPLDIPRPILLGGYEVT
jgi:hypothetical protein